MRHIVTTVLLGAFLVWVPAIHNPDTGRVNLTRFEYYKKAKCDAHAKNETDIQKKSGSRLFYKCVQLPPSR